MATDAAILGLPLSTALFLVAASGAGLLYLLNETRNMHNLHLLLIFRQWKPVTRLEQFLYDVIAFLSSIAIGGFVVMLVVKPDELVPAFFAGLGWSGLLSKTGSNGQGP